MSEGKSKQEQDTISLSNPRANDELPEIPSAVPVETLKLLVENGVEVKFAQADDMSGIFVVGFEGIIEDEIYLDLIDSIFGRGIRKLAESKGVSLESLITDLLTFWILFNRINVDLYRIQKQK